MEPIPACDYVYQSMLVSLFCVILVCIAIGYYIHSVIGIRRKSFGSTKKSVIKPKKDRNRALGRKRAREFRKDRKTRRRTEFVFN